MVRVVLDTNVVVSAYLVPSGKPASIISLARHGEVEICLSDDILEEIKRTLLRPKLQRIQHAGIPVELARRFEKWTKGMKRMAHLRALLRLALSDVHQYYPQPANLALHRTCAHPLHSFRPLAPQPNVLSPVPDVLRNIQIGRRRPQDDDCLH